MPDPNTPPYYCKYLQQCFIGKTVLDVGCGNQHLKSCLPKGVQYFGMDPFPIVPNTIERAIDDPDVDFTTSHIGGFETICAFAVMDGVRDFSLACQNMKKQADKNVIFLTGLGIDVDSFHTHRLELSDFTTEFNDWVLTQKITVNPKVWVLEFTRV